MFYHVQILGKKGPLALIWLASHHDKRLKRSDVYQPDLPNTCDSIIQPEVPLALRLSGQLMLGIVRIYNRRVGFLFQDCADSFGRMKSTASKQQQREGVNLSKEALNAGVQAITLPELEKDPDFMRDDTLAFAGSAPGTPISLIGSLVSTPEKLRRASIDSDNALDGLRRSLSFEGSPHAGVGSPFSAVEVDDMLFTDEKFGSQMEDEMAFDIEPETLRSEDIELATPVREDKGRTTLTPVQEDHGNAAAAAATGSPDLEEVAPFNMDSPAHDDLVDMDDGGVFATPEVDSAAKKKGLDLQSSSLPKKKRRKVVKLVFDVNSNTGEKQISLDNKYVRSRLRNAEDTLRDLEKDVIEQSMTVSHRAKRAKTSRRKSRDSRNTLGLSLLGEGPVSVRGFICEDLLGLFGSEKAADGREGEEEKIEEEVEDPEMLQGQGQGDELEADHFESPLDMGGFGTPDIAYGDHFGPSPGQEDLYGAGEEEEVEEPGSSPAVGGHQVEEEEALEVDEEGWSSRTKQVLSVVKSKLLPPSSSARAKNSCNFEEVLPKTASRGGGNTKRDAATHFFECLVLSSKGYVNLHQQSAFSPITITARDLLSQEA